jgi:multicomponent Na+:H+ antiporter subunit C
VTLPILGLGAAALVGIGLYGLLTRPEPLRRVLACNLLGGGVLLLFGALAPPGGEAVTQAIAVTGLLVGGASGALALALLLRLRAARAKGDEAP